MTIRVHVHGADGRMGGAVVQALATPSDLVLSGQTRGREELAAALARTRPDVLVEFTVAESAARHLRTALEAGVRVVSGTTGLPRSQVEELARLANARGLGCVLAPNFALGAVLLERFARQAARWFDDVEILELHHERKRDAPSGTALRTAQAIAAAARGPLNARRPPLHEVAPGARGALVDGVPIHSIRLPGLLAHQEVVFGQAGQVLTLRHDTLDRAAYWPGIALAIRRVATLRGFVDSLVSLLDETT
jgi:4-hydroxy-tetrahydrodipicolinate reductase